MANKKKTITEEIKANIENEIVGEPTVNDRASDEVLLTIKETISYYEMYLFPPKVEIIKQKYLNAIDRIFQMKKMWMKNRSNRIYPLIASVHDTFVANLHEVETTPRIVARQKNDQSEAPVVQWWYDWARDISWYARSMMPIRSEATLIGTSYARSWFFKKEDTVTYMKDGKPKSIDITEIKPTIKHVSFFQLFYDPFADSFENCPWKAYRYINNLKDTGRKYSFLFNDPKRLDKWKSKIKWWSPLSSLDYTRVYASKNYEREIMKLKTQWQYDDWVNNKLFTVSYADQDLVEVIEYWQDDMLILFINWVPVYEWDSPYPFTWDPFSIVIHEEVPGQIQWIGIGDKLMNHQINANTLFSGLEDAMRMHLYPMYKSSWWALKDKNGKHISTLTYEPEKVIEDKSAIGNGWIEVIKWIDFNAVNTFMSRLSAIVAESYEIIGLNSYTQWGNGKMERSAAWVSQKTAIIRTRLLSIVESLNSFNSRVFSHWLAIWLVMFPETFNFRIIDEDWTAQWKDINLEDVVNKFDVVAESEAMRAATKELKATQSIDALSKISPLNLDPLTWLPIYHIEEFMESFMDKMDFPTPKKYTEAELIELVQMKARIDAAAQPPAPVEPETTTPQEVLPEQVTATPIQETPVENQLPSDASLLPELQL